MYGFYDENRDFIHAFIIVAVICFAGIWLVHDHYRNEPIYSDTDRTMESIEKRLDDIGNRVDSLQKRNAENQETVQRTVITIRDSRENAATVADGLGEAERRLDNAIQASGRIKNRIADIEAANKQREKNP